MHGQRRLLQLLNSTTLKTMISDTKIAREISQLMLNMCAQVDESLARVREQCPADGAGLSNGNRPDRRRHPDGCP
jgi:hypothetical protein